VRITDNWALKEKQCLVENIIAVLRSLLVGHKEPEYIIQYESEKWRYLGYRVKFHDGVANSGHKRGRLGCLYPPDVHAVADLDVRIYSSASVSTSASASD
jgi:hypothetical protein